MQTDIEHIKKEMSELNKRFSDWTATAEANFVDRNEFDAWKKVVWGLLMLFVGAFLTFGFQVLQHLILD